MCLVTSYVGHKNAIRLDVDYDSQLILPLLIESLMLNAIEEPQVLGSQVDSKDLFHIVKTNPNILKHFMSRKLNKFYYYPLNVNCKCALSWWQMKSHKFLTIAKLAKTHYGHSSLPNQNTRFYPQLESSHHFTKKNSN